MVILTKDKCKFTFTILTLLIISSDLPINPKKVKMKHRIYLKKKNLFKISEK